MTIEIIQKTDTHYLLNGKSIIQTMDGEWTNPVGDLTTEEIKFFHDFLNSKKS